MLSKGLFFFASILFFAQVGAAQVDCHQEECSVEQATFEEAFEHFREMYPQVQFSADWNENRPMAFASFRRVVVSGGFARKNDINLGGLLTVTCHEIGHALFRHSEGEADYYASNICLKNYFAGEDHQQVVLQYKKLDEFVSEKCSLFKNPGREDFLCARVAVSSFNAATADQNRCLVRMEQLRGDVLASNQQTFRVQEFYFRCLRTVVRVNNQTMDRGFLLDAIDETLQILNNPLDLFLVDQRVVPRTYHQHNSPQCRMDTLLAGYFADGEPGCWYSR